MERDRLVKLSKRMSKVLRHDPGRVGLLLDPAGWVSVEELLRALSISRAELDEIVAGNDKRRFAVAPGPDGVDRIRASQGHSVPVDLELAPATPPDRLYHGTGAAALASIMKTGLERRGRHQVHLSVDEATAHRVGSRRGGRVVILTVDSAAMARAGHTFTVSDNGVWLVDAVPPAYLSTL